MALGSLFCIWAALFTLTWAHWGDLTIDCGREMYVPAQLAKGRTLYADLWYPYTPGGPYLNALLFHLFGEQLRVLYWAGALGALGSAVFLFLAGLEFGSVLVGWAAGAVVLIQSFVPSIFSFPMPYSFGAVYGCLSACLCLWLALRTCSSRGQGWMVAVGLAASSALLMKQEMGVACFATLGLLIAIRGLQQRTFRQVALDALSLAPGCILSAAVILWMVSLKGFEFLTQENMQSWPTSYFMRKYGTLWLSVTGLAVSRGDMLRRIGALSVAVVLWLTVRWILGRFGQDRWLFWTGLVTLSVLFALAPFLAQPARFAGWLLRWMLFPQAAPFFIALMTPAMAWLCWRGGFRAGSAKIFLLFFFTLLFSFRIMFGMQPSEYPTYYDGPVFLAFLLVAERVLSTRLPHAKNAMARSVASLPYFAAVATVGVILWPHYYQWSAGQVPFATSRGVIYTLPEQSAAYHSVLVFIQDHKQSDESFLSVPEDTSLYFLAGLRCPARVYAFTPGVLSPGKMIADTIHEIEQKKVRYLIWSNRSFPEYSAPIFGVDFDQELGEYLKAAYKPMHRIGGEGPGWRAVIWERIADGRTPRESADTGSARRADGAR